MKKYNTTEFSSKRSQKEEKVVDILKQILPEKVHWRLETLFVLYELNCPVSSYRVRLELIEKGYDTSIGSVHPFFEDLLDVNLCFRDEKWGEVGRKFIKINEKGKEFCKLFLSSI